MRTIKICAIPFCLFALYCNGLFAATVENTLTVQETEGEIFNSSFLLNESKSSGTGRVEFIEPDFPNVAASADFGVLKGRSSATYSGIDRTASTDTTTDFGLSFKLDPAAGGLSLADDDPVSLLLSFRLDGLLGTSSGFSGSTGSADMSSNLRIWQSTSEEFSPSLVEFQALANVSTTGNSSSFDWLWNLAAGDGTTDPAEIAGQSDIGTVDESVFELIFDTGILTTTIDTTFGATLNFSASLDTLSQARGGTASGAADFFNSYGLVLSSLTEGVLLDLGPDISLAEFDLGDTAVIPVPAAVWLFGTALIGLLGLTRRNAKQDRVST